MHDECRFSVVRQQDSDTESLTSVNSQKSGGSSRSLLSSFSSPSSSSSSCTVFYKGSLSSRSRSRRRKTGAHNKRLHVSEKGYAGHVPVFLNNKEPTNIVLEPFPNRRLRSLCVAGGALVTAHRNGIRVYRQRYLTSTEIKNAKRLEDIQNGERESSCVDITDIRTGIWESVEFRDDFKFRDAYLCAGVELVFNRERFFPLKWNRYLAVACGTDRTYFSVCVLSAAAHFVLHHELHEKNKVVALNFSLVPLETKSDTRRYQPFVVSVDEIGEVVIFDVENNRAVKLLVPSTTLDITTSETATDDSDRGLLHSFITNINNHKITSKHNQNDDDNDEKDLGGVRSNENFSSVINRTGNLSDSGSTCDVAGLRVYRLDCGLASAVSLVGDCQVYCKHCGDVPSVPGTLVMSLYISSRSNSAYGQAELQVTQLSFRWTFFPPRAVLINENHIIREGAPEEVCDMGIAMMRVPFYNDLPQQFMIGRPRLRFWSISGCSGKLLQLHRVYNDMDGSGKGARMLKEHFVRVVPLGRHVLIQDITTSWLCIAALTDDDVILLLGTEPLPTCRNTSEETSQTMCATEPEPEPEMLEKQTLEQWLNEVEQKEEERTEESEQKWGKREQQRQLMKEGTMKNITPLMKSPLSFMDPKKNYTVLMVLTPPGCFAASPTLTQEKSHLNSRILVFVPQSNELLFFMGGTEKIYSVKLPFECFVTSIKEKEQSAKEKEDTARKSWGSILRSESVSWMESTFSKGLLPDLQIARPLMNAVFGISGEVEVDRDSLFPLKETIHSPQEKKTLFKTESVDDTRSDLTTNFCTSVPAHVDVKENCSKTARRKKYRSSLVSVIDADSHNNISHSVSNSNQCNDNNIDAQETYIDAERRKILKTHLWSDTGNTQEVDCCFKSIMTCTQITTRDEPMQRDAIVYEWSDTHDNLYVQFINEMQELTEKKKTTQTTGNEYNLLAWPHQQRLHQQFRLGNINDCIHSAGFMRAFREAQQKRLELSDKGGVFDFVSYFASNVVPQRVLDLQENDRCRFELADLKVNFDDDMSKFKDVETVVVYENEERKMDMNGRRLWMPHNTFPFDDEYGNVVDIAALNLTAVLPRDTETTTVITVPAMLSASLSSGWRWENDVTDGDALRPNRPQIVRKELHLWNVGEWMYAERWPTREEEINGVFKWSTKAEIGAANVRRRLLTRNRINIAVNAAKEARHEEYKKKLLELRMTLGL